MKKNNCVSCAKCGFVGRLSSRIFFVSSGTPRSLKTSHVKNRSLRMNLFINRVAAVKDAVCSETWGGENL